MGQELSLESRAKTISSRKLETQIQLTCEAMHDIYVKLDHLSRNNSQNQESQKRYYQNRLNKLRRKLNFYDNQYNSMS